MADSKSPAGRVRRALGDAVTAVGRAAGSRGSSARAAAPAKKAPATKTVTAKATPAKKAPAKAAPAKKAPAKEAPAAKTPAKKAPAKARRPRRRPAKAAPAKKAPAKAAPAKKAPAKAAPVKKAPGQGSAREEDTRQGSPGEEGTRQGGPGQGSAGEEGTAPRQPRPRQRRRRSTRPRRPRPRQRRPRRLPPRPRPRPRRRRSRSRPRPRLHLRPRRPRKAPKRLVVREDESPWTAKELAAVRTELQAEVERLRQEISVAEDDLADLLRDSGDGAGDDQADAGTKTFEREHEMSLANNSRDMLDADRAGAATGSRTAPTASARSAATRSASVDCRRSRGRRSAWHASSARSAASLSTSRRPNQVPIQAPAQCLTRRSPYVRPGTSRPWSSSWRSSLGRRPAEQAPDRRTPWPSREDIKIIGSWLTITYTRNPGAAFSLGTGTTWIFTADRGSGCRRHRADEPAARLSGLGRLPRRTARRRRRQPHRPHLQRPASVPGARRRLHPSAALRSVQPRRQCDHLLRNRHGRAVARWASSSTAAVVPSR